ncbi:MAG: hypothetical protein IKC53_10175 [Lentisphaeria bacterium]|nr:hypothetical protein [Lentisphaeria bacterium]
MTAFLKRDGHDIRVSLSGGGKDKKTIELAKPSPLSWFELNYFSHKDIYPLRKNLFFSKKIEKIVEKT